MAIFHRTALIDEELDKIISSAKEFFPLNRYLMSRVSQELRDQGIIEFFDDCGTYRLLR